MADMLVNLLKLPEDDGTIAKLKEEGINIRRVQPFEISHLRNFALSFSSYWADEVMNAFRAPAAYVLYSYLRKKDHRVRRLRVHPARLLRADGRIA